MIKTNRTLLTLILVGLVTCPNSPDKQKKQDLNMSQIMEESNNSLLQSHKSSVDSSFIQSEISFTSGNLNNWLQNQQELNNLLSYTEEQLPTVCQQPITSFFKGATQSVTNIWEFIQTLTIKKLPTSISDNASTIGTFAENIYSVVDNQNKASYTVKVFPRSEFDGFIRDVAFMKKLGNFSYTQAIAVGYYYGCLYDNDNLFIIMQPGKVYQSLSDPDVHTNLMEQTSELRKQVAINLSGLIKNLHASQVAHGNLSADSILVNDDFSEIRLINFRYAVDLTNSSAVPRFCPFLSFLQFQSVESIKQNDIINLTQLLLFIDLNFYTHSIEDISRRGSISGVEGGNSEFIKKIYNVQNQSNVFSYFNKMIKDYCPVVKNTITKYVAEKEEEPVKTGFSLFKCCTKPNIVETPLKKQRIQQKKYNCNTLMRTYLYTLEMTGQGFKLNNAGIYMARLSKCPNNEFNYQMVSNAMLGSFGGVDSLLVQSEFGKSLLLNNDKNPMSFSGADKNSQPMGYVDIPDQIFQKNSHYNRSSMPESVMMEHNQIIKDADLDGYRERGSLLEFRNESKKKKNNLFI